MSNPHSHAEAVLGALGLAVLERRNERAFSPVGSLPAWFAAFGSAPSGANTVGIGARSPFLDNFLVDAEAFWARTAPGRLESGLWTETDADGIDWHFEATAVTAGARKLLIVSRLSETDYPQRQRPFQIAREALLRQEARFGERLSAPTTATAMSLDGPVGEAPRDHDGLTGLPNRLSFEARLSSRLSTQRASPLCVLLVALDHYEQIEARHGRAVAETVLRGFAARLWACGRESDEVARSARDEFAVLLAPVETADDALRFANALREILEPPFDCGEQRVSVTASLGGVLSERPGITAAALLGVATRTLLQARQRGGGACLIDAADAPEPVRRRLRLDDALRQALDHGQFTLVYQPRVRLADARIVGFEALLRWQHPTRGTISPLQFVPHAENSGLIVPIGNWVLRQACRQLKAWQQAQLGEFTMSVNMSVRQLEHPGWLATVQDALATHGLAPASLEVELTESVLMHNVDACIDALTALAALGVGIAIDDFGTGYSSLGYLKRLPAKVLKIDRAFVVGVAHDDTDAAILAAIVAMARRVGMTTVAEGVEQKSQFDALATLGCDAAQGYWTSPPVAASDVPALVRQGHLPR